MGVSTLNGSSSEKSSTSARSGMILFLSVLPSSVLVLLLSLQAVPNQTSYISFVLTIPRFAIYLARQHVSTYYLGNYNKKGLIRPSLYVSISYCIVMS